MLKHAALIATLAVIAGTSALHAHTFGSAEMSQEGDRLCIQSDATPNHEMGSFPNSGNPHHFRAHSVRYCVDATPERGTTANYQIRTIGIALNGVPIRPETADWYDASRPRGMSRDSSSGWRLEGMGNAQAFGIDAEHAHVDHRGLYHYHAVSPSLVEDASSTLIGYAADGFEIHYFGSGTASSWQLKEGTRPTAPFGAYDGRFEQDYVFKAGSGDLDECNGATINGQFVYVATDTYPFFPRCLWGTPSSDF
ncbi:MAG: YHYH protein [Pseudomonadota bacterium]